MWKLLKPSGDNGWCLIFVGIVTENHYIQMTTIKLDGSNYLLGHWFPLILIQSHELYGFVIVATAKVL